MKFSTFCILSVLMLVFSMNVNARRADNLIYNSEEVNGLVVSQTVYKNEGNSLSNFMKYNYKYDAQNRVVEQENMKWNEGQWSKDLCLRHTYSGKQMTTEYYKWNNKKQQYILAPEMTITVDQQ